MGDQAVCDNAKHEPMCTASDRQRIPLVRAGHLVAAADERRASTSATNKANAWSGVR